MHTAPTNSDSVPKNDDSLPRPKLQKRKSSKLAEQSLVITYSMDPKGFEEVLERLGRSHRLSQELERRVETAGYLFTQATLKTNLMDLSPLTAGLLDPQTI
jgi:hypothetical protein